MHEKNLSSLKFLLNLRLQYLRKFFEQFRKLVLEQLDLGFYRNRLFLNRSTRRRTGNQLIQFSARIGPHFAIADISLLRDLILFLKPLNGFLGKRAEVSRNYTFRIFSVTRQKSLELFYVIVLRANLEPGDKPRSSRRTAGGGLDSWNGYLGSRGPVRREPRQSRPFVERLWSQPAQELYIPLLRHLRRLPATRTRGSTSSARRSKCKRFGLSRG